MRKHVKHIETPRGLFIAFFLLLVILTPVFAQQVLVDDAPFCGHHTRTTYQVLWDSLTVHGATVDFTTITGRFPDLSGYDLVILMHHNHCGSAGFSESQRGQLIDFVCYGGNLLIMPICWDDVSPHNDLLHDSRWMTGLTYGGCGGFVHSTNIAPFPPLTNGVDYLHFECTAEIYANPPAYPFAWDESGDQILAAVSYPYRLDGEDCDCHLGGRIIALADCHTFETGVVGYTEPMDFLFAINTTGALAHIDEDTLENCFTPPGVPRLDSLPCADPGETAHIYGDNIPPGISLLFDGSPISSTWHDSTHISFTVPLSAVQGYHIVTVQADGRDYPIQIQVYCDWLDLLSFEPYCADIGDTVWFSGENISLSASMTFGGAPLLGYDIISSTSGWFIVPDTSGLTGYPAIGESYRYRVCLENEPTQFDCAYMLVPCPCPPDSDIAVSIVNVRFWERTDGTDTVYIVYDLIADDPQDIVLYCSDDGGLTYDVPCTTITGAVGDDISPGDSLVIVWPAGDDVPDMESSDWTFRLEAAGGELADSTAFISSFARAIGGWNSDRGYSVVQTADGGYAVAGRIGSYGAGNADLFLVKFSSSGSVEWSRAVGGTGQDGGYSVVQTADGGYVVAGFTYNFGPSPPNFFLVKFSSAGDVEWSRAVGGWNDDYGFSVVQTTDGGYAVAGHNTTSAGYGADLFLVKFSSAGAVEWSRTVGGFSIDYGYSIVQTSDGGYAVAGRTDSFGAGSADLFLVKFSSTGSVEWSRAVGGTSGDGGWSVVQTADGGYAVAGCTANFGAGLDDLFLVKFSSTGTVEWSRAVGGTDYDGGYSVVQTADGGYAVAGYTHSFGAGDYDLFLVKFSSAGDVEWSRAVGGWNIDRGESVVQTTDGGYAVAGATESFGAGFYDLFLVKFDSDGNSCIGDSVSPTVTVVTPTVTDVSPTVTDTTPTVTDVSPTITTVSPTVTNICDGFLVCPYGGVYAAGESDPGPVDTYEPRITATCPPGGEVGASATINWSVIDSFIPPLTLAPPYSIELWFSPDGGSSWDFIGASDNTGSFNWAYPSELTTNGMIAICATDSFGHTACDTCGTFAITGDTISPWGYAYGDTCSPDSIIFILHDNGGFDYSTIWIQDPLGVLTYPDSMYWADETTLVFYPRLPDSLPYTPFVVRLSLACDSSGNCISESIIEDDLTVWFYHPCCYPLDVWLECPPEGWSGFSSCTDQSVAFGVRDTTGQEIDTTRIFIRRSVNGIESDVPVDSMIFSRSSDTFWVIVPGIYSELDSVWIIMDSLFTLPGCRTEP